jgi:hypothetical protein
MTAKMRDNGPKRSAQEANKSAMPKIPATEFNTGKKTGVPRRFIGPRASSSQTLSGGLEGFSMPLVLQHAASIDFGDASTPKLLHFGTQDNDSALKREASQPVKYASNHPKHSNFASKSIRIAETQAI